MHIVHFCPTPYTIPPDAYGGTERVVYWLVRAQHAQGLRVSVIAHPESQVHRLHAGVGFIPWTGEKTLDELLPADTNVIHLHRVATGMGEPQRPYLVTEHGNRAPGSEPLPNTVFVSESHARVHGRTTFVRNGVPVEDYRYSEDKDRFMLSLARMEWKHKNARTAMDLAVDLDLPLSMSGKYPPWLRSRTWGAWCLHPFKHRRLVTRLGYIGGERKLQLLSRAAVFFHAVNWHEPAGLAPMEAMASGTPVLATPNGAHPEFVIDGETGVLVRSYEEALEGLRRLIELLPAERRRWAQRCRERVPRVEPMADGYLRLYERVIAGETLSTPDQRRPATEKPIVVVRKPWLGG